MKSKLIISLVILLTAVCIMDAEAQKRRRTKYGYRKSKSKKFSKYSGGRVGYSGVGNPKYSTIGLSLNTTSYFGDLSPNPGRFSTDYLGAFVPDGLGITYSKVLYPGIFFRGGFNWGNIKAEDYQESSKIDENNPGSLGRYQRNLHFKNSILELSAGFELDMLPSNSGARGRFPINPYLFVGIAGIYHSPKAKAPEFDQADVATGKAGQWVNLQEIGASGEDYSKFQLAIPIGLGAKFKIAENFDINLEFGFRYLFFDHLDDVGGTYLDLNEVDDPLKRSLIERGSEEVAELSGSRRDLALATNARSEVFQKTGEFTTGPDYAAGAKRGGGPNDFYVMTQIRLVYILNKKQLARRGKFR